LALQLGCGALALIKLQVEGTITIVGRDTSGSPRGSRRRSGFVAKEAGQTAGPTAVKAALTLNIVDYALVGL
jgi:hypothetical protein